MLILLIGLPLVLLIAELYAAYRWYRDGSNAPLWTKILSVVLLFGIGWVAFMFVTNRKNLLDPNASL